MKLEDFICNCFWMVNESSARPHAKAVWLWGDERRFIRLEKVVSTGPPIKNLYGFLVYRLYPMVYQYDVVWDSTTRNPKLLFNIYDCEGTRLKMQSVCSLLGIKYNLDADDDDSLDVELHPILNMPYFCLPCKLLAQPNGQWLDIKNPILRYLLKYTSFTNLTQEELLELSDESPYIE
uniref:Uncharacterized protein n=1 Tax=Anopheles coluzzii TaxID=1518534 RepID=A0A8W7PYX6_ANOCL